ncbi:hypothetical protein AURDEDRAFT_145010, partial [Auricularia subglabra TFB-10046 SS5]
MPPRRADHTPLPRSRRVTDATVTPCANGDSPPPPKTSSRTGRGPFSIPVHFAPELWCSIWRLLSPRDRCASMLVCRHWRQVALGDLRLWTRPTLFTAVHAHDCTCKLCAPRRRRGRNPEGWDAAPRSLHNQSNSPFAANILARSRSLDIEVTVD